MRSSVCLAGLLLALSLLGAACADGGDPASSVDPTPPVDEAEPASEPDNGLPEEPADDPSTDTVGVDGADGDPAAGLAAPVDEADAGSEPESDDTGTGAFGNTEESAAPGEPSYDFSAVAPVVEAFIADNDLNGAGLIVVRRDEGVIHHQHWGVFGEDRISLVASSSKMITAGVLLHLDDQGLLDIDAPVADAVEWGVGNPEITPAQLISNSSGLVGLLPNPTYGPYLCQFLPNGSLRQCGESIFTTAADDADIVAPDTEFIYGGGQWQVAGALAEAVSGKSWAQLIDEIYVEPCDLDVLAFNNHFTQIGTGGFAYPEAFAGDPSTLNPTENPHMGAGAYVTTGDYGKLLLMHLSDGYCGESQVLSGEALARMHTDRIAEAYDGFAFALDTGYGMGWWVDRETGVIRDGGAYGSVPWLDLEDGYGVFLVIEATSQLGGSLADQLEPVVEAAIVG